jgi:hypothetical protein
MSSHPCHYCDRHGPYSIQDPPGCCRDICEVCFEKLMGYRPGYEPTPAPMYGYLVTLDGERLRDATGEEWDEWLCSEDGVFNVDGRRCRISRGVRRGDGYYSH